MSAGHSSAAVIALLDEAGARAVESLWRRLEEAGFEDLPSRLGQHPHITLAVLPGAAEGRDAAALEALLRDLAARQAPVPLHFPALAFFPTAHGEDYYFLAPAASAPLLALHRAVHEGLEPLGLEASPQSRPGEWTPHCSLSEGVKERRAGEAVASLQEHWQPIDCRLDRLALVTFPPHVERLVLPLAGSGGESA